AVGTANAFTGFPAKPIMSMPRTFTGSSNCRRANAGHLFVQVPTREKPGSGGLETGFSLGAGMSENGHSTCDEHGMTEVSACRHTWQPLPKLEEIGVVGSIRGILRPIPVTA
ncbi:hypothetical protein, partial [Sphingomonas sp. CFBP 13603]|uniref:hypothetical protein n=1 Tax=Sphingomonas sp. CFBP 13603 TaxID=2774040 RepID=UPI001A7EEB56